ncbi:MAG TPA: Hpt domain-containing protein, partial [Polyangiaceae bacterium]|nr:Hpt domain-containing protein [Polyangiaceae bacterium]
MIRYPAVTDQGRDDFLNEAQDIIEAFARNLLSIDAAHKRGVSQPELINEAFREIHTLKGLSSLFGAKALSGLTHKLEDLLDGLRLGRIEISAPVLDVLFSAVDVGHQLLANPDSETDADLQTKAARVIDAVLSLSTVTPKEEPADNNIDPAILGVLTEYEEHRLRANIDAGQRLFRVRVQFDLMTIDSELSALKDSARQLGEVITYLPTGEATAPDVLELDLVLASSQSLSAVTSLLGSENAVVHEIPVDRGAALVSAAPPRARATGAPHSTAGSSFVVPSNKPLMGMSELPRKASNMAAAQINEQRLARRAVRVDIYKLDRLMNVVGELAILRSNLYENAESVRSEHNRQLGGELHRLHRVLERRLEDLQNGILEMRMVPLGQIFDRLARGVRQISRDLGKEVRLVVTGAETEIDKLIVEELGDPLLHMLRNAIDHGIEEAPEREKARKSQAGTIALNAYQKGSHVLIEV